MRTITYLFIGLLVMFWTTGATWFYICEVKGLCEAGDETKSVADILQEQDDYIVVRYQGKKWHEGEDNIVIAHSNPGPSIPEQTKPSLQAVADFISEGSNVELEIVSAYVSTEENLTDYKNIGIARADSIKRHMEALGVSANSITVNAYNLTDDYLDEGGIVFGGIKLLLHDK